MSCLALDKYKTNTDGYSLKQFQTGKEPHISNNEGD